ncbi:sulfurtransferase [Paenibacillus guangzhouensis]|uniref:sulfurtransferase n=1 Tax=Paenibacillus guangzhouensis TaxID=1473112 RepID=UPI0012677C2F|nr:sulfurtransferase [Paenibacillus guangzhouensis]
MGQGNIVSMTWVHEHLGDSNVILVDCRFMMGGAAPNVGQQQYEAGHLPGAYYLDLDRDLSSSVGEHGGRHPLPDIDTLASKFSSIGIDASKHVVAYDDQGGMMASRLWWLLQYTGHTGGASIMDDGFTTWAERGYPTTTEIPEPTSSATYVPQIDNRSIIHIDELRQEMTKSGVLLIDSREAPRYRGEVEPIDAVAGHIPGALNAFWKESLDGQGLWRSADEQKVRFVKLGADQAETIIVYCGSGVSACPNVIALQEAGYKNVRLYAGSWSDWISYEGNPIATGEE